MVGPSNSASGQPTSVTTDTSFASAGADTITVGPGNALVLGGTGNNTIRVISGAGNDVLVGANGTATLSPTLAILSVATSSAAPSLGGNDTIQGGAATT